MALAFKRSRNDTAEDRTFPNAKETVIFRNDVTNKNLLKNPWRTATEAVGQAGVLNRPSRITTDNRGNVFAQSFNLLREGVSNKTLLMNPYNFMVDPTDEKRTLSRQVIMDINNGTAPKFIRENKGIDEIAFTILQLLPDNGVKLATISMLKSYITGRRLLAVLDQGGQKITRSFDVFNQLVSSSKNLYKNGELGLKVPSLLLKYSESMKEIFGDSVLQDVMPQTIYAAIQDLASVSTVLSKLFRSENMISASTNLSIDEWAAIENNRLQKIKEVEQARQAQIIKIGEPPMPVRIPLITDKDGKYVSGDTDAQWAAKLNAYYNELSEYMSQGSVSGAIPTTTTSGTRRSGDNYPTGTQGVLDPDNIKQEGGKRKKKKILKVVGGYRASSQQTMGSTIKTDEEKKNEANINKRPNTQPPIQIDTSNSLNTTNKVNTQPPIQVEITNQPSTSKVVDYILGGITSALSVGALAYSVKQNIEASKRENRVINDDNALREAIPVIYPTLSGGKKQIFDFVWGQPQKISPKFLFKTKMDSPDVYNILSQITDSAKLLTLLNTLNDYEKNGRDLNIVHLYGHVTPDESRDISSRVSDSPSPKREDLNERERNALGRVEQAEREYGWRHFSNDESPATIYGQIAQVRGEGRGISRKKSIKKGKGTKNKKKSSNLDAQILALLKA